MKHRPQKKNTSGILVCIAICLAAATLLALPFLSNSAQSSLLGTGTFLALCLLAFLFYFLPTLLATGCVRFWAILAANILLAWTLIGWAVILVWAIAERNTRSAKSS